MAGRAWEGFGPAGFLCPRLTNPRTVRLHCLVTMAANSNRQRSSTMKAHTSSAQAFTRHRGFGDVAPNVSIFAVQQGVSAVAALEYAQCLLGAASTQVRAAADAARDTDDANIN